MRSSERPADRYARALLDRLGCEATVVADADHPALAWRRAGLMAITGTAAGAGLIAPVALAAAADGALAALKAIAPALHCPANGAMLLGERARLLGLTRRGRVSANGSCRLLAARDGTIALNLPRADDWDLLPAWLGQEAGDWEAVGRIVSHRAITSLIDRGRLLGLAVASSPAQEIAADPFEVVEFDTASPARTAPLVIDLSALWAGPLAGGLLRAAGARVIKVESVRRPDGARRGHAGFFDLLNAGKESVALDFTDDREVARLRRLIDAADIVIESTRPRALEQLGIDASAAAARGVTWLSITGHGRAGAAADWIGYGDDAAVAGGLTAAMARGWGEPLFAGDAIADPLTGIIAALAGWAGWRRGGGRLIALSLAGVVAHACRLYETDDVRRWQAMADADGGPLYRLRPVADRARILGADTAAVLDEFASRR